MGTVLHNGFLIFTLTGISTHLPYCDYVLIVGLYVFIRDH